MVETDDSDLPENFKSFVYAKYENCLAQYEETKAMIFVKLKLLKPIIAICTYSTYGSRVASNIDSRDKIRHSSQGASMWYKIFHRDYEQ